MALFAKLNEFDTLGYDNPNCVPKGRQVIPSF